jgi:hypothetical protein
VFNGNVKGGIRGEEERKFQEKAEKKKKAEADALLASLYKNMQSLNAAAAEDPSKNQSINMYKDPREGTEDMPETIITCLHFLDAVENEQYGWRWECPQGGAKCQYRHMLPEGYILTSKKDREAAKKAAEEEKKKEITIEEQIEEERAALKSDGLTPVTKESFFAWKERRKIQKQKEAEDAYVKSQASAEAKKKLAKGKNSVMNGRALFTFNPDLFQDNDFAMESFPVESQQEESKVDENLFANEEVKDEDVDFD